MMVFLMTSFQYFIFLQYVASEVQFFAHTAARRIVLPLSKSWRRPWIKAVTMSADIPDSGSQKLQHADII